MHTSTVTHAFAYRRYTLPFRTPVRTAHGVWTQREGLLVRLESEDGKITFGECAPLPWFGTETVDEAAAVCAALGACVSDGQLDAIGEKYPCLGFALNERVSAHQLGDDAVLCGTGDPPVDGARRRQYARVSLPTPRASHPCHSTPHGRVAKAARPVQSGALPVAALLPAGRAAFEKIPALAEAGFRAFKWKVGASCPAEAADELALLGDVLAALPAGALLRLDANGAWTRRTAERWLARCADYRDNIEFVEQPVACDPRDTRDTRDTRRGEDLLLGLAGDYPTPLALDESIATAAAIDRWLRLNWPGIFVIKPSLLGCARETLEKLPPDRTVFSSALETIVGAQAALRMAFRFYTAGEERRFATAGRGEASQKNESAVARFARPADTIRRSDSPSPRALGFGVRPLFTDARFDAPPAAPFIRAADLDTINSETPWNALN